MIQKRDHLSFSSFKQFMECEAAAAAGWKVESKAFLEGKYFEEGCSYGEHRPEFIAENPAIFKKDGTPRAEFVRADAAIYKVLSQDVFHNAILNSEKQHEVRGEIAGVPFIGYVDLHDGERLSDYDLKYVRDFAQRWDEDAWCRVPWWKAYHYDWQAAIYHELDGCDQHIIAATKETVPDIAFLRFSDETIMAALAIVETYAPRFWSILQGEIEPSYCGKCDYCKAHRQINNFEII